MNLIALICIVVLVVSLALFLINLRSKRSQNRNTITLASGEVKPIPSALPPLLEMLVNIKRLITGEMRGIKGIKAVNELAQKDHNGSKKYKAIQSYFLGMSTITTWDPEIIRTVLFAKEDLMGKFAVASKLQERFFGDSIFLAEADKWKTHKTALSPAFAWKHVQSTLPAFVDIARQMEKKLALSSGEPVDMYTWLKKATLDAIGRGGFGFDFHALNEGSESREIKVYESLMKEFMNPIHFFERIDRLIGTYKKLDNYMIEFDDFMQQLIKAKRDLISKGLSDGSWKPQDILDYLLSAEANQSLTDRQIAHDMNTFFIAGHETTAGGLNSALHLLSMNPEAQDKLRQEINSVCGENGVTSIEDIRKMTYLDCCLNETLRIIPPAFAVTRKVAKDQQLGDLFVTKGCMMLCFTQAVHTDKELWGEDAHEFRPERFSPERKNDLPKHGYLPFSMGSRQCIGNNFAILEMKTFLAVLIQRFQFSPDKSSSAKCLPHLGTTHTINPDCRIVVTPISE